MEARALHVLVVGPVSPHVMALLDRLARDGWESYTVEAQAQARIVLQTLRFGIVLASENLADGSGYDLAGEVARRGATLFVGVEMSESCVWLPVVEHGARTRAERALDPAEFEAEIRDLLRGQVVRSYACGSDSARGGARARAPELTGNRPPFPGEMSPQVAASGKSDG